MGREVKVVWLDSYGVESGWQNIENYSAEPLEITSFGRVIYETDDVIALAHNYASEGERTAEQANGIMIIPKVCVKTISSLTVCDPEPVSEQKPQQS